MGGCVVVLAGCGGGGDPPAPSVTWHESSLPTPAGARALVRDASYCGGRWYVVGATATPSGETRPAVWSSTDAARWRRAAAGSGRRRLRRSRPARLGRLQPWPDRRGRGQGGRTARNVAHDHVAPASRRVAGRVARAVGAVRRGEGGEGQPAGGRSARLPDRRDAHRRRCGLALTGRAGVPDRGGGAGTGQHGPIGHPGFRQRLARRRVVGDRDRDRRRGLRVGDDVDSGGWRLVDPPPGARRSVARHGRAGRRDAEGAPGGRPRRPRVRGLDPVRRLVVERLRPSAGRILPGSRRRTSPGSRSPGTRSWRATATAFTSGSRSARVGGAWTDLVAPESVRVNGDHQLAVAGGAGRFLLLADDGTRGRVWVATAPG